MLLSVHQLFSTVSIKLKQAIRFCNIYLVAIVILVISSTIYWKTLDTRTPSWDAANHLLHGYEITRMLSSGDDAFHIVPQLIKSSFYYPPFYYFIQSIAHLVCGQGYPFVDDIPCLLFLILAICSLFYLGKRLLSEEAALIGVFIFSCYPAITKSVHPKALLDLPLTAMVFLGLGIMVSWKLNPTWFKTIVLGVVIGLTGLTKQYGLMFFVPGMFFILASALWKRDWKLSNKVLICGAISSSIFLFWLIPNLESMMDFMIKNRINAEEKSFIEMWFNNAKSLFDKIPNGMTWAGLLIFLGSFFNFAWHKSLSILITSCLFCAATICALNWDPYQFRYVLPLLGYTALTSGALCWFLWNNGSLLRRSVAVLIVIYFLFIYLYLNYSPYPVQSSQTIDRLFAFENLKTVASYTEPLSPLPYSDWGYEWMFEQFKTNNRKHTYVNVLPDTFDFNTLGLNYLARSRGKHVTFMTFRDWTTKGYNFEFEDEDLDKFNFFLSIANQKKKDGAVFTGEQASNNYQKLKTMLKERYRLVGKKILPNQAVLQLYENVSEK